jgi:hypothetical protein
MKRNRWRKGFQMRTGSRSREERDGEVQLLKRRVEEDGIGQAESESESK